MITLTSFIEVLTSEIERIGDMVESKGAAPPHHDSLLSRLAGLSYEERLSVSQSDKAISAAGGFAQALERQDLEPKLTNEGRLLHESDEEADDEEESRDNKKD